MSLKLCRWIVKIPNEWPFDEKTLSAINVEYTLDEGTEARTLRMFSRPQQRSNMITIFLKHVGRHWKEEWKTQFRKIQNEHMVYMEDGGDLSEEMAEKYPERCDKGKRERRKRKREERGERGQVEWIYAFATMASGAWKIGGTTNIAQRVGQYHGDNRPARIVLCKRVWKDFRDAEDALRMKMLQCSSLRRGDGKDWFDPVHNGQDLTEQVCEFMRAADDSDEIVHRTDVGMIKRGC